MTAKATREKVFPVCRVGQFTASREVGIFFPILYRLECTGGGGGGGLKTFFLNMENKILVAPFRPSRAVKRKRFFFFFLRVA